MECPYQINYPFFNDDFYIESNGKEGEGHKDLILSIRGKIRKIYGFKT